MAMQCSGFRYLQVMVYCEAAQEQHAATQELDLCLFFFVCVCVVEELHDILQLALTSHPGSSTEKRGGAWVRG